MMDKRIIINADDFGLCEGVNRGIRQAHTEGVLTSATIMANMPGAKEAVEIAKKLPNLGVGVHLNLSDGKSLLKDDCVKCLLDNQGQFTFSPAKLSLLSMAVKKIRKAIRAELAAQIQWVIDNGLKPTHLDSHKHIHCFPVVFSIVCELAKCFGISAIRFAYEPKKVCQTPWPLSSEDGRKTAGIVRAMAKINRLQNTALLKSEALFGITHTGKIDISFFKTVALYNSATTAEVMTHPGYIDGLDCVKTRLVEQRKVELNALCSEKTKQYFKDAGIKLVHYGQL